MSEPATAPAPVAAPTNVSTSPAAGLSLSAVMAKVAGNTGVQDAPQAEAPVVRFAREAPSAPVAETPVSAGEAPPVDGAAPDGAETPAVEAAPVDNTVGEVVSEDGDLTLRAERNADGTFKTKLDPSQKFDFEMVVNKATGEKKKYSKTIPEIMRMAKDGVAMQQALPELKQYREHVPALQQRATQLEQRLEAQMALMHEVFANPEAYTARRDQYAQEMSPEKRLARMEAEREQERTSRESQDRTSRHAQVANSFVHSRISPELDRAEATLGVEMVTGKVTLLTSDLVGPNGVIPPAHWPEMERRIVAPDGPFQQWLKTESAKRSQIDTELAAKKAAAEDAQRRAQQAVNDTGRTIAPIGRAAPDTPAALPKARNVQEVTQRMIHRPLPTSVQHAVGTG